MLTPGLAAPTRTWRPVPLATIMTSWPSQSHLAPPSQELHRYDTPCHATTPALSRNKEVRAFKHTYIHRPISQTGCVHSCRTGISTSGMGWSGLCGDSRHSYHFLSTFHYTFFFTVQRGSCLCLSLQPMIPRQPIIGLGSSSHHFIKAPLSQKYAAAPDHTNAQRRLHDLFLISEEGAEFEP